MKTDSKNKMIGGSDKPVIKNKNLEQFHYAGEGKYYPVTIEAISQKEADEKYEKTKVEVTN